MSSGGCFAELSEGFSNVDFHLRGRTRLVRKRRLPQNLIISLRWDTAVSDVQERDWAAVVKKNCTRGSRVAMVPPIHTRKPKYREFQRASKLVNEVLQLLAMTIWCRWGVSKVAHTYGHSLRYVFHTIGQQEAQGTVCVESSAWSRFDPSSTCCHTSRMERVAD